MKRDDLENLKHNTKLDVRMPDQLKDEFLARCREEGVSSGSVIRSMVLDYLFTPPHASQNLWRSIKERVMKRAKWIAGGVSGAAIAAVAASGALVAPVASADDLQFVVAAEYRESDTSNNTLGEKLVIFEGEDSGESYAIRVSPRICVEADIEVDAACQTAFDVEMLRLVSAADFAEGLRAAAIEGADQGGAAQDGQADTLTVSYVSSGVLGQPVGQFRIIHGEETSVIPE